MHSFLTEAEVYHILKERGLGAPLFYRCSSIEQIQQSTFSAGDAVVIKGEVEGVEHKSELGLVKLIDFDISKIEKLWQEWQEQFGSQFIALLIVERVAFTSLPAFPSEIFLSIRKEEAFGHVARLGIGGIHSEFWAQKYPPVVITPLMTIEEILEKLSYHLLGHLWFGLLRQQTALITVQAVKHFIQSILNLLQNQNLPDLLEVNPFVIVNDRFVALDGLGVKARDVDTIQIERDLPIAALLQPTTLAIAGVSSKKKAFGNLILDNILHGTIKKSAIKIIKAGSSPYSGIETLEDIKKLKDQPVDNLILALPPQACVDSIKTLCEQGGGAQVTYLVAGGIGDGADKSNLGHELQQYIINRQQRGLWVTRIVGPNSLGIVLSPLQLNTLFISPKRLPIKFSPQGKLAFLSQSGAFFITRLSTLSDLPVKYAFCIGNQLDITMGELLEVCTSDSEVTTFSLYLEGFREYDLRRIMKIIRLLKQENRQVIVYKGGRSEKGALAAAGHTGSIAGTYAFEYEMLSSAGALVCNTMEEFSLHSMFYARFAKKPKTLGIISNAGFETVRSADLFDKYLAKLSPACLRKLITAVEDEHLSHLVSATNPMDVTPMAKSSLYYKSAAAMISEVDLLVVSLVPLTDMLSLEVENVSEFARQLATLQSVEQTPIVVVVDSGSLFNEYRNTLRAEGLMVLSSLEKVALLF